MNTAPDASIFSRSLKEHLDCFSCVNSLERDILRSAEIMCGALRSGGKILVCGNGGSAADAQHFAAEIVGRFYQNRRALPAIALTTDTSIMTAVGNDFGFDNIFSRQVEALGNTGDTLLLLSTSGNSHNLSAAAAAGSKKGLATIALLGKDGGELKSGVDIPVVAPSSDTPRIQEVHGFIVHVWAEIIESSLCTAEEREKR